MLYAIGLHLLAGIVAGLLFRVPTLLLLLFLVVIESIILFFVQRSTAGLIAISNLVALQLGYLAGVYGRAVLEQAGNSVSKARTRRIP